MSVEEITLESPVEFDEKSNSIVSFVKFFDLAPFHKAWYDKVGSKRAQDLEKPRFARDGSFSFHVTVASANEVKKYGLTFEEPFDAQLKLKYLGKVENEGRETWFIIVDSDEINRWREENGLHRKDLHITLGFDEKDIRHLPKGESAKVDDDSITRSIREWLEKHPQQQV